MMKLDRIICMKGKNECVFSPHHISAWNYKFSLILIKTLQLQTKLPREELKGEKM